MSTASAPVEIGTVALTVADLDATSAFYRTVIGLQDMGGDGAGRRLGAGGRVLVELRGDRAARRSDPREAGLFHTAFLLPDRRALARWLIHAAGAGVRLQGASDHGVSEAIYLADPEGNGIEVYADRPRAVWHDPKGRIRMTSDALDLNALARAADGPWQGAPEGSVVGHVHLQVGDVAEAEAFYAGMLGLAVTAHYPGAAFFGAGGYHHHLAANVWNSRGAEVRAFPATGLAEVELLAEPAELAAIRARVGAGELADPWGTTIRLSPKAG
jgi:catechol 2,3-dioxygenase